MRGRAMPVPTIHIERIDADRLVEYCSVPIQFRVTQEFKVAPIDGGLGGFSLDLVNVKEPWTKDYPETDLKPLIIQDPAHNLNPKLNIHYLVDASEIKEKSQ